MAIISDAMAKIRQAIYGKDVRENIASGIEAINTEVENTTTRQTNLENTFEDLIINAGSSNAEIVLARGTYSTLQNRLDDIKVGGRNLVRNYSFNNNFDNWVKGVWALSAEKYRGNNVATLTTTTSTQTIYQIIPDIKPNTKYSMSIITKTTAIAGIYMAEKNIDGNNTAIAVNNETIAPISSSWTKVTKTFTTQPDTASIKLAISMNPNTTMSFAMVQLEEGTYVTDARPAPEDEDAALATRQSITDNTLATTAKTVSGAINEINGRISISPILFHSVASSSRSVTAVCDVTANTDVMLRQQTTGIACVEYNKNNCVTHDVGMGTYFKAPSDGYYTFMGTGYLSPSTSSSSYTISYLQAYIIESSIEYNLVRTNQKDGLAQEFSFMITLYMTANQRIRFTLYNIASSATTANAAINQLTIIKETT
jgi:hypothetical protein